MSTTLITIVVALAAIAAVRRLARVATALAIVAIVAGAGPSLLDRVDRPLRDVGLNLKDAVDTATSGVDGLTGSSTTSGRRPKAIDGDTFKVRESGKQVSVRVALIDAGESSATRYGSATCGGSQGKRLAQQWVAQRSTVRVRRVTGLPKEDRYGRRIARVVDAKGRDYGLAAVRSGWARITVYEKPRADGAAYLLRLRAAEAKARTASRGAWGACNWKHQDGVK